MIKKSIAKRFEIAEEVFFADILWEFLPEIASEKSVRYREVPRFPEVRRDLALLIDRNVRYAQLEEIAFATEKHLLKRMNLFDVYEGEKIASEKKSYAVSFILNDTEKTLNDKQIEKVMERLLHAFKNKLGAEIRQ
jgi:phenylalanyl-tRNA synthetase beta chain